LAEKGWEGPVIPSYFSKTSKQISKTSPQNGQFNGKTSQMRVRQA